MRSFAIQFIGALSALLAFFVALPSSDAAIWRQGAVAADHPLASQIGADVLARGGHAVDAAVATALALGVLNNFASGIGGGGFALVYDTDEDAVQALDFRESAPQGLRPELFFPDGRHDPTLSVIGGLAPGVPGEIAGLWALHQRYGKLPWHELVAPSIQLAAQGFEAHELLVSRIGTMRGRYENDRPSRERFEAFLRRTYVFDGPLAVGTRVQRPNLANALQIIALEGGRAFYEGTIANDIVRGIRRADGVMNEADLANYQPIWRTPLMTEFRGYRIASFPPPSSAGIIFPITLFAYEALENAAGVHNILSPLRDAEAAHRFLHALTWGFAVRANLLGDPAFVDIDLEYLTGPGLRATIVESFNPAHRLPPEAFSSALVPPDDDGTAHFSVVDRWGNSVALTTTVNTLYGSQIASPRFGIVLNNEMNDFATAPDAENAFALVGSQNNAVRPGARPLSSMAPTLVFHGDQLVGSLGGSGGPRIITGTLLTLMALIAGAESTEAAIDMPRIHHQWIPAEIEIADGLRETLGPALEPFGYVIRPMRWSSSVQGIWRHAQGWDAASDRAKLGAPAGTNFGTRENQERVQIHGETP